MLQYIAVSLATALEQLFWLFGLTFALAWALYLVSTAIRNLGFWRLHLKYFYLVAPGVACHETGHALGCLATGRKIYEFVPFRPVASPDGGVTLGWVKHSVSRTLPGRAGDFVIATGPVWFGGAVILLLVRMLVGASPFAALSGASEAPREFAPYVQSVVTSAALFAKTAFSFLRWHGFRDVLLAWLIVCVASEITLSGPDLQGMWVGLVAICAIVILGNCVPVVDLAFATGFDRIRPALFVMHATLTFALILDVVLYAMFRCLSALFSTR